MPKLKLWPPGAEGTFKLSGAEPSQLDKQIGIKHWFSFVSKDQSHQESLFKQGFLSPTSRASDTVGLRRCLTIICISNKFPGSADAAGPGRTLEEHQIRVLFPQCYWINTSTGLLEKKTTHQEIKEFHIILKAMRFWIKNNWCIIYQVN